MRTATIPQLIRPTTRPVKTVKPTPKPANGHCSLTLKINGQRYKVRPLPADFGGIKAFRLTKADGSSHDVSKHVHGRECSCADFVWRRDGLDERGCKHIRACKACGLID
jgi:hypothetical protein